MLRLALELGAPHSDYLEEELTMRQVSDWLEYYQREPWGYEAADTRNAMLALVTAQAAGVKNVKLENFRLRPREGGPELSDDEMANNVRAIFNIPRR